MALPPQLLNAISTAPLGRVVLVIGAGTSLDPPTSLPLSSVIATEAHRRLMADGILPSECDDPADLSSVADRVYELRGRQRELVERLPRPQFLQATPNEGHLLAAALLIEGALKDVLTINYDLAIFHALSQLGAAEQVAIIQGPEDHNLIGQRNVVYLHRSASADPEDWIVRSISLESAWRDAWEAVVANMLLAVPFVAFVGLGSPAMVLTETVTRIGNAVGAQSTVFYVGPEDPTESEFFKRLNLSPEAAISMGWIEFMRELAERVVGEQGNLLRAACVDMAGELNVEEPAMEDLCARVASLGLIGLGRLRAAWILEDLPYLAANDDRNHWMADLILAVAMIERLSNTVAQVNSDGLVEFRVDQRTVALVVMAHGRGRYGRASIEDRIVRRQKTWGSQGPYPRSALISGINGPANPPVSSPVDIVGLGEAENVVDGADQVRIYLASELRRDPTLTQEIIGS